MVNRALLVMLLCTAPVAMAAQDDGLSRIQAMIARPAVMCGAFTQRKTLVGIRRPVVSSGRFCVATDHGVLWNTQLPFAATLRLTRSEIVESQGDRVTSRLSAGDEPSVSVISDLLFAVLAGDLRQLRNTFRVQASADATSWRAQLVPKDGGMKRVIGAIALNGAEFVRDITITEASGDQTAIAFTGITAGLAGIKPEEARALGISGDRSPPR
jgi:hypothetical protein